MFDLVVLCAGAFGGAVAAIAGFGIGSLLTPAIAAETGTKLAVALVSIPHAIGTSIRFWRFRRDIDWTVVRSFGLTSAAGGLTGALLNTWATSRALEIVFGCLLMLAGGSQITGYAKRWRLHGRAAWLGGALSGFFGGLVGNQGGIRTASMLGFEVDKRQFVATTTAVALLIDMARVPAYVATETMAIAQMWPTVGVATIGVVIGTLFGERMLARVPEQRFRVVVGGLLLALGVSFLIG
ncbi:MAG TPA: sulfite exporter TauE/SafE family protein [Vicinamibacterales bacterium]|nr:sulfite exporter TauE/SafE family protein [Vicinamibacterales bacterium]